MCLHATVLLVAISKAYAFYLVTFGLMMIMEVFAKRDAMTVADRARGLKFWALLAAFDVTVIFSFNKLRDFLGVEPLIGFSSSYGSAIAAAVLAAIAGDFVFYWFHRFQHRFLWRWHSVHHSIENLSAANSYHHWTEPLWSLALVAIPLSFVELRALPQAAWLALVLRMLPFYIHSSTVFHFGPLSRIVVDNRYHRIHHSVEGHHHNRNFSAITPLWDWLFGTAYFPKSSEWPKVGLTGRTELKTVRQWLRA